MNASVAQYAEEVTSGSIFVSPQEMWSPSSGVIYWVMDTLADVVAEPAVAARLREVSEFNLGCIALYEFESTERTALHRAIEVLPELAKRNLPDSDRRQIALDRIEELVLLAQTNSE